jgi:hypothetical protein
MNNAFTANDNLVLIRRLILTTLCWKNQVIRLWPIYAERSS